MRATDKLIFINVVQEILAAEATFLNFYRTAIVFAGLAVGASRTSAHPAGYVLLAVLSLLFIVYGACHYQERVHRMRGEMPKSLAVVPLFVFAFVSTAILCAVIVVFFLPRH